jgi:RNA polymerase sigma-70 factor (ECF subfamily)
LEDSKIIELYFARDEAAITETSEKYGYYCKKIAMNILADLFESEECVNDTYVKVWNTVPPTVPNIFKAFLAKITRNLALDRYTEKTAKKRGGRVYESLEELSECIGSSETEDEINRGALTELINSFLSSEGELSRRMFVRRYFYQDSVAEIAKRLRVTESRVKTTLHRARVRLAELLREEGFTL